MGEALLRLLETLPEPVITFVWYKRCVDACNSYMVCKEAVAHQPPAHQATFHYIVHFLRELLQHSDSNHLTPEQLAISFGDVILRPPPAAPGVLGPTTAWGALAVPHTVFAAADARLAAMMAKKRGVFLYRFISDA